MRTDLRHAIRALRRAPVLTLTMVAMLALGIGASTSVFAVVDGVLLRPLAYPASDALLTLTSTTPAGSDQLPMSMLDAADLRTESRTLESLTFARGDVLTIRGQEGAEHRLTAFVGDDFFRTTGVRPALGRPFTPDELAGRGAPVAVISHRTWQRHHGGDPDIIGTVMPAEDGSYTIIGVMPPGVAWPEWAEMWAPLAPFAARDERSSRRDFRVDAAVLARLAPGVTADAAQRELDGLSARLAADHPTSNAGIGARVRQLRDQVTGDVARPLMLLLAAVTLLFLVACTNVANLMLLRTLRRGREMAVRTALGAGRLRIVRQLVAEAVMLAGAGAALGVLIAPAATQLLLSLAPSTLPRAAEVAVDGRAIAAAAAMALIVVVIAGVVPALRTGVPASAALRAGSRGTTGGRRDGRLQGSLVVGQIAFSLTLLAGATLVGRSFVSAMTADVGFDVETLLTVRLDPPAVRYESEASLLALYEGVRARASALPGVEGAAVVNHIPLAGRSVVTEVRIDGVDAPVDGPRQAIYRLAGADYFATMRQRLTRGRDFAAADQHPTARVAVLNETAAREFFGTTDPVGRTVTVYKQVGTRADFGEAMQATVIGVAADVATFGVGQPAPPEVYLPMPTNSWGNAFVVVRTTGTPERLAGDLRRVVHGVDPLLVTDEIRSGPQLRGATVADRRFGSVLLGAFAGTALVLTAAGVFAVTAAAVTQRTREIGIRVALGAGRWQVMAPFVRRGLLHSAVGVTAGIVLALALARLLGGAIFGVEALDIGSYLLAASALGGVVLLATVLPARRALTVQPTEALRAD